MKKTTLLLAHFLTRRACLWTLFMALSALAYRPHPTQAAVTEAWVQRYSNVVSNSNDQAIKVVRDAAGDIVVTGTTDDRIHGSDLLTIKYSGADGSVLWQQRYTNGAPQALAVDCSGNAVVTGTCGYDYYMAKYAAADGALIWEQRYKGTFSTYFGSEYQAVAVDGSGNVAVTGVTRVSSGTNSYDYYTAKYAATDGALLWEKRYNGPANGDDVATAAAVDGSGNVVVTGFSVGSGGRADYYTAKYARADGALLWEKRYNGTGNDEDIARAVAVDASGNVVVTGYSWGGANGYDYYTAKYAATNGVLLWEKRYNSPANSHDIANALVVDGSGNVVVTGDSSNGNNTDYYTAKYAAANGVLLWEQRYHGPATANSVAVDGSGNVVVTGFSWGNDGENFYTAKYAAANGALLWEKRAHGGRVVGVVVDGSGNVVVTGTSRDDYYTAKYAAADSALLWEQRYNGPSNGWDAAHAVAVDGSGNVVVTGFSGQGGGYYDNDYYTAKYAAADGALLWEQRYNGPANSYDIANAVTVDGTGNVVVTGQSIGNGSDYDYYTAKYAAANGAVLWEQRFNGPGNLYDYARGLAVDGAGNVVVTGWSCGTNGYSDYYTAKYAATDGALLWEKRYNGPGNLENRANAVAVDDNGNVVVTGYSYGTNVNYDYYTAKYAAANGALLWEKRYNGPANNYDRAQAVTVDGSGNVVVTGYSSNGTNNDYYTAKYAAADGALLWEKRYNGEKNGFDHAYAVAVDGIGNVVVTGLADSSYDYAGDDYYTGGGDYYTAKYAAADGALLWEKRYNGPANGFDRAYAVAVDGIGNVVVTGVSDVIIDCYECGYWPGAYYTAKYAAADGALLWEKRYNRGVARSVTLGPYGMVAVTGSTSGDYYATGDYVTVVYRDDVYPISIALVPVGVRLRFIAIPGHGYTIERAPAVNGPWTALNTQTAPASGLLEYLDAPAPPGSAFYRTVQP